MDTVLLSSTPCTHIPILILSSHTLITVIVVFLLKIIWAPITSRSNLNSTVCHSGPSTTLALTCLAKLTSGCFSTWSQLIPQSLLVQCFFTQSFFLNSQRLLLDVNTYKMSCSVLRSYVTFHVNVSDLLRLLKGKWIKAKISHHASFTYQDAIWR